MLKAVWLISISFLLACGDDAGDYADSCAVFCEPTGNVCDEGDIEACEQACITRTNGLSVSCASCVIEESTGLSQNNFECRQADIAVVTDPVCAAICDGG